MVWSRLLRFVENRLFAAPAAPVAAWVGRLVKRKAGVLPPAEALRFLFAVDATVRDSEEQTAVRYGEGIHTKHRHMAYHEFFAQRISKHERVLDVGCGMGAVAYDIAESSGAAVLAVDIDDRSIHLARERFAHPRVVYEVRDVIERPPRETCDVIVLSNVLEHLPDRPVFLRRLSAATNAKRLLIRVPLFERDWMVPLRRELGVEWRLDLTHEIEYTQESFAAEMREAGLDIVHRETRWGEIWAEAHPSSIHPPEQCAAGNNA